ncbi:MAG TPA: DUF4124 domain-containing protein [Burkholderiaceae bacterium]|nr:DUF4124 domain-containing protein [Burkholderiaceae bacterium]
MPSSHLRVAAAAAPAVRSARRALSVTAAVLTACLAAWSGAAGAQIYRCEAGNGVVEYSNAPTSGKDRNCKSVDLPTITTVPAPKAQPRAAAPAGNAARPDGFPRVDNATQKTRDSDRKRILEDELRKEEAKVAELKKEYNGGEPERQGNERNYQRYLDRVQRLKEDIDRSEGNIASLRRELGSVRE